MDDDIEEWLASLPTGSPIDIDGEAVYLNIGADGAELGAYLYREYTLSQLQQAMKTGFQSALQYDAGLGLKDDALLLTQWLPRARNWVDAGQALENLLNQIAMWRERLGSPTQHQATTKQAERKTEHRLRKLFAETR